MAAQRSLINCYEVLGIPIDANGQEISAAYRKLALIHHPDKASQNENSKAKFLLIQQAVETLRDTKRREDHDRALGINRSKPQPKAIWEEWYESDNRPWQGTKPRYNLNDPDQRYMYTYGTGVHMDPNSETSKAKKARHEHDIEEWEAEYAGIDPEVEKAKAEMREETMRKQAMRDVEGMEAKQETEEEATEMENQAPALFQS